MRWANRTRTRRRRCNGIRINFHEKVSLPIQPDRQHLPKSLNWWIMINVSQFSVLVLSAFPTICRHEDPFTESSSLFEVLTSPSLFFSFFVAQFWPRIIIKSRLIWTYLSPFASWSSSALSSCSWSARISCHSRLSCCCCRNVGTGTNYHTLRPCSIHP